MKKKQLTEAEMHQQQDQALANQLREMLKEQKSGEGYLEGVAAQLRTQVIDPAVLAGAVRLLKAHRDGLYDAIPVGDIDAMGLLNIIQNHLAVLDETIQGLQRAATPEAEVIESEDKES
jgi:hypothetical protein